MKYDNDTDEDIKRAVSMKKSTASTKERSPDSLSRPNLNTILIKCNYFKRYGKKLQ